MTRSAVLVDAVDPDAQRRHTTAADEEGSEFLPGPSSCIRG
jgi:hypothetical protein